MLISHMCFFTCTYNLPSNYLSNGNSLGYVQPSLEIWNNGKWKLPWLAYKIFSFFGHVNPWNKTVNLSTTYTGICTSPCFLSEQETSPQHRLLTRHLTAKCCKISRNLITSSAYMTLNGSRSKFTKTNSSDLTSQSDKIYVTQNIYADPEINHIYYVTETCHILQKKLCF
jgi:hypothetical protein